MKPHFYHTSLLFFLLVLPGFLIAQPEIISVAPSAALPGETINLAVTGVGTNFLQGQTVLDFGPEIQVLEVQVNHSQFLTALIQIAVGAQAGFHSLSITTGAEVVALPQAFEILQPGNSVNVVLTIIPVQTLYLSDLNPNAPADNPLLFSVTLYNDNQQRNLHVQYILSNDEFGTIGSADKFFTNLQPLSVETFDNRQFDEYHLDPASPELLDIAAATGVMPAGTYTYTILVFDENGNVIDQDEGVNVITNETSAIDLISPGAPLEQNPEVTPISTPFFQWFSTLNEFDFALYEVNEGQESANEITANLPVYEEHGLTATFLQYPISAEILVTGKTYAWQVTSPYQGSQGAQMVFSPVHWFEVGGENGSGYHLSSLEVGPEVVNVQIGRNYQFEATGLDQNGEPVPMNCTWSVVPSTAGTVNSNGFFTAGSHPGAAAVVASCGGLQAYATATITWSVTDQFFDVERLFDKVFGLKPKN
jgi:hypothetical protein